MSLPSRRTTLDGAEVEFIVVIDDENLLRAVEGFARHAEDVFEGPAIDFGLDKEARGQQVGAGCTVGLSSSRGGVDAADEVNRTAVAVDLAFHAHEIRGPAVVFASGARGEGDRRRGVGGAALRQKRSHRAKAGGALRSSRWRRIRRVASRRERRSRDRLRSISCAHGRGGLRWVRSRSRSAFSTRERAETTRASALMRCGSRSVRRLAAPFETELFPVTLGLVGAGFFEVEAQFRVGEGGPGVGEGGFIIGGIDLEQDFAGVEELARFEFRGDPDDFS